MEDNWTPPKDYESRPIVVLGGGVLGRRIAACWASAGYNVRIRDPSQKQLDNAVTYVHTHIAEFASLTTMLREPKQIHVFQDLAKAVEGAWLVFEAVPEKLQLKIDTFADLEKLTPSDCILASNSSSYKSGEMLEKVSDHAKTRILNTHYMMPPDSMIVELMTDGHTDAAIFPFLVEKMKEVGLHPYVAMKESTGFIFNRIWAAIKRECLTVISEGVSTPEQLDGIWIEQFGGKKVGPCQLMDQVGLDTVAFIEQHYIKDRGLPSKNTTEFLESHYLKEGKLGNKSDLGGLYPPKKDAMANGIAVKPHILVLDTGLSQPLQGKALDQLFNIGRVLKLAPDSKSMETLVKGQYVPDGLAISKTLYRLFWSNMGFPPSNDGSIMSSKLDGSDIQVVVPSGTFHTPKQICIDDSNNKIYICDREGLRVWRCGLDGKDVELLVQTGDHNNPNDKGDYTKWCVGITVAAQLGKFFWTQKGPSKGNQGRIFSANIEMPKGSTAENRTDKECLLSGLPEPVDLEYDESTNSLYWTDRGEIPFGNTLNKVQLDQDGMPTAKDHSNVVHEIIAQNFDEAIGLKLDLAGKHVYVADIGGTIWMCDLDGGHKVKVYEDKNCAFTGLTLI